MFFVCLVAWSWGVDGACRNTPRSYGPFPGRPATLCSVNTKGVADAGGREVVLTGPNTSAMRKERDTGNDRFEELLEGKTPESRW